MESLNVPVTTDDFGKSARYPDRAVPAQKLNEHRSFPFLPPIQHSHSVCVAHAHTLACAFLNIFSSLNLSTHSSELDSTESTTAPTDGKHTIFSV